VKDYTRTSRTNVSPHPCCSIKWLTPAPSAGNQAKASLITPSDLLRIIAVSRYNQGRRNLPLFNRGLETGCLRKTLFFAVNMQRQQLAASCGVRLFALYPYRFSIRPNPGHHTAAVFSSSKFFQKGPLQFIFVDSPQIRAYDYADSCMASFVFFLGNSIIGR
jgi:hypothetical protein